MTSGESEPILTVNRSKGKWIFAIFFGLGLFCSLGLAWSLVTDFHHSTTSLEKTSVFSFLLIVFVPYTVYNLNMILARRFVLEVNEHGIKTRHDKMISWEDIYLVELNVFPSQGLRFLYYLIGPRGLSFYQLVIYEDYLLKTKRTIRFSSDIESTIDKINEAISYYTIKNNIPVNWD